MSDILENFNASDARGLAKKTERERLINILKNIKLLAEKGKNKYVIDSLTGYEMTELRYRDFSISENQTREGGTDYLITW